MAVWFHEAMSQRSSEATFAVAPALCVCMCVCAERHKTPGSLKSYLPYSTPL